MLRIPPRQEEHQPRVDDGDDPGYHQARTAEDPHVPELGGRKDEGVKELQP